MGLHQNYPMPWGGDRMEGLSLDLGLDGMFSPLPTELDPCALFHSGGSCVGASERKPDVFELSLSYPLQSGMHPETIILDDDTDDEEFLFEERYTGFGVDSSRRGSEERGEFFTVSPVMPLRQIKQHVRGLGDHDWLPSDLLDASHSERRNEAKRVRENGNVEHHNDVPQAADMNQAIQEMPQETAEAFKELIRLVAPFEARASRAIDEMESKCSIASDIHEHTSYSLPAPASVDQASRIVDEMENWHPLASDFHDDRLPSQHSATTSDFEQDESPPPSTTECSPHPAAIYEQQHASKRRRSNADVVLYEPKQEPVESGREHHMSSSIVHVKEEPGLQCEPTPDPVSIRPVSTAVPPCYSKRKLILTALNTFEVVRQQILRDPSYGQPVAEPQTPGTEVNGRRLRADLKAASMMRSKGFWLNESVRPIGDIPGVTVGDCFRYRMEMAVIGLHRAVQAGIAFVPESLSPYGVRVASSVVLGVGDPYQDDKDMGDRVIYSGQGGLSGKTKESQDQALTRGNLALSNSYEHKLPVRFIRGHKVQSSTTGILYSYDGLYQVTAKDYRRGVSGKMVYFFTLDRLPGQAPILSGYPVPLESQPPVIQQQTENGVHWTEPADTKPLYLEKRPVA